MGVLLLSMNTNELSWHILQMCWFTLRMKVFVSLLLTTIPEFKILVTPDDLHFKVIFLSCPEDFGQSLGFHHLVGH